MKFEMSFGLKIGCFSFVVLLFMVNVRISTAQSYSTFDLPVYGIYNKNIPTGDDSPDAAGNVYWDNLAKAFQQDPKGILPGIEDSRARIEYSKRLVRDQYGRKYLMDPTFGLVPVTQYNSIDTLLNRNQNSIKVLSATPVILLNAITGYLADNVNKQIQLLIPRKGYLVKSQGQISRDKECNPDLQPMMSFDDGGEAIDPCSGKAKKKAAEFGLTATSGMSDIMCMFCQHIKNLQCIWQFCSHPEGVYKIKVSDSKN